MYRKIISLLFIVSLLFVFLNSAFGEENDEDLFTEEEQIKEMIKNSKSINSEIMDKLKEDKNICSIHGVIPEIKGGEEYYEWWCTISRISDSIAENEALNKYLWERGGYITGYGPVSEGYILISIEEKRINQFEKNNIEEIVTIFEKYAIENNVTEVPLVFKSSPIIKPYTYQSVNRPLVGGISLTSVLKAIYWPLNWLEPGTGAVGYPARTTDNTSCGFVTAGHVVNFTTKKVYQPSYKFFGDNNYVGSTSVTHPKVDAAFIKSDKVNNPNSAKIFYSNSSNTSGDLIDIGGYYNTISVNSEVYKSGPTTCHKIGKITGYQNNVSVLIENTTYVFDKLGIVENTNGQFAYYGDSGGPVYTIYDNKAILVGIIHGGRGYGGDTFIVPCGEIKAKLNVIPLTK